MTQEDILFAYRGHFTPKIGEKLLDLLEPHLSLVSDKTIRKKIFYISVEMIQNISNYNKTIDKSEFIENPGNFIIRRVSNSIEVITTNYVRPADKPKLKNLIDKINNMNKEALAQEHYSRLSSIKDDKPSAKIGILSIARRISKNLEYKFMDLRGSQYFVLKVHIS